MGETSLPVTMGFNGCLRIESRVDRQTGDPDAVPLRKIVEQSGIVGWMTSRLTDRRSQVDVTHDLASLVRTARLLAAQGWRGHDDADALRLDPAFRAGHRFRSRDDAAERSGVGVAADVSRFTAPMAEPANPSVLREAVLERAGRGIRAGRGGPGGRRPSASMSTARRSRVSRHAPPVRAWWRTATSRRPNGTAIATPGSATR